MSIAQGTPAQCTGTIVRVRVLIAVPISRSSKLKGAFPYVDEDRSHTKEPFMVDTNVKERTMTSSVPSAHRGWSELMPALAFASLVAVLSSEVRVVGWPRLRPTFFACH